MLTSKTTCRVIYGDTDKMGFAYYANYFRWFEQARADMFRSWGLSYREVEEKGFFMPVSEAYCKYISSVDYDDILIIETELDTSVKAGIKFNYLMLNEDNKTVAKGHTKHACLNSDGKVVRPPGFLTKIIKENS
jgi:acyl-CoA thioester hydrolase